MNQRRKTLPLFVEEIERMGMVQEEGRENKMRHDAHHYSSCWLTLYMDAAIKGLKFG